VDELDAMLLQSRADLRDIRLAVLFSRTLSERSDRLHFLADFIHHFQGQRAEGQDVGLQGAFAAASATARPAAGGLAAAGRGGSAGVGWTTQGNMWMAQEEGAGQDVEEGIEEVVSVSRSSSGFSAMGSTARSKFSTLPRPSPRSASISVGLGSLGSAAYSQDAAYLQEPATSDSEPLPDSESEAQGEAAWENGGNVTELQVLNELRSLPGAARREALRVIRNLSQGVAGTAAGSCVPSSSISSPQRVASSVARAAPAGRSRVTKLTDSEPEEEDFIEEVPPGGAGVEETDDDQEEASASSWHSIEDNLSNDSSLARLAPNASRAHAAARVDTEASLRGSSSSGTGARGGGDGLEQRRNGGRERNNLSVNASPAAHSTPHRRTNYFVDNLDLESPNKVPEDSRPCFEDQSDEHEMMHTHSADLVFDVRARTRASDTHRARAKTRHAGQRGSDRSNNESVESSSAHLLSVRGRGRASERKSESASKQRAALPRYDYSESVSSTTNADNSEIDGARDSDGGSSIAEHSAQNYASNANTVASHSGSGLGLDRDVQKELTRRIMALVRERERVGFLNVSFTSKDLEGLAKLVERVLRNKGLTVDEQLRSMLHNAFNKYRHLVIQDESDRLVQDVAKILQKERVFHEVVARMDRGYEQELRDYQHYPDDMRGKLMDQLQVRRNRDIMRLEKERRARGHSFVQNVHSDSPDDSVSRASALSDDFDAILDAAVPGAPADTRARGGGSGGASRRIYEDVSSSAECATEDTHSSSRDSTTRVQSGGSSGQSAAGMAVNSRKSAGILLTPSKLKALDKSPKTLKSSLSSSAQRSAASSMMNESASAAHINGRANVNVSAARSQPLGNGRERGDVEVGWVLGGSRASPGSARKQKQQKEQRAMAPHFQDAEFQEITIADLPCELPAGARAGRGAGNTGPSGSIRKGGGSARGDGAIDFGAQGLQIPVGLAEMLERRRLQEQRDLMGNLAQDFLGMSMHKAYTFAFPHSL